MATTWAQVSSSPDYQNLQDSEKEAARAQYFNDVVAPNVPKEDLSHAQAQFFDSTAPKDTGFFSRMGEDYQKRLENSQQSSNDYLSGKQSAANNIFRQSGILPGVISDTAMNVVGSGLRYARDITMPEAQQEANMRDIVNPAVNYLKGSQVADAASSAGGVVGQGLNYLNKNYPISMADAEVAADWLGVVPAARFLSNSASLAGGITKEAGGIVRASGEASQTAKNAAHIESMVAPKMSGKAAVEAGKNTYNEGGLMGNIAVEQSPWKQAQTQHILDAGITNSDNPVSAIAKINSAYSTEAENLAKNLSNSPVKYQSHISDIAESAAKDMADNSNLIQLSNDGQNINLNAQARLALNKAQAIMLKNENTPSGLLKSRQEFDTWAKTQKSGIYEKDSIAGDAARAVRNQMNLYIEKSVPDAAVAQSLAKQSALIRAEAAIAPKAAALAGTNKFTRLAESITGATTPVGAAIRGIGGGIGLVGAPIAAGASAIPVSAAAAYGGYKAVTSPTTRKIIGGGLEKVGNALQYGGDALAGNAVKSTVVAVIPEKTLSLPNPNSPIPNGALINGKPQTYGEATTALQRASKETEMGYDNGTRAVQQRNARSLNYDAAEKQFQAAKQDQMVKDWMSQQQDPKSALDDVLNYMVTRSAESGQPIGPIGEAMLRARENGNIAKTVGNSPISKFKNMTPAQAEAQFQKMRKNK